MCPLLVQLENMLCWSAGRRLQSPLPQQVINHLCYKLLYILPPFQNIKCFSFMKQMYLGVYIQMNLHTKKYLNTFAS
jgi:hypothetical protein